MILAELKMITMDRADAPASVTLWSHGDLQAAGEGVMLWCGDPQAGSAGYVAIETVRGQLGDRQRRFDLQRLGMLQDGAQTLHYVVVPGSGEGELDSIAGRFDLTVEDDDTHHYELEYEL